MYHRSQNYRRITFNTILNQFTRDDGDRESGLNHPITQTENQQIKLQNCLRNNVLPNIPIYNFIGISYPETIIDVIGEQEAIVKVVAHGEHIRKRIMDMEIPLLHV